MRSLFPQPHEPPPPCRAQVRFWNPLVNREAAAVEPFGDGRNRPRPLAHSLGLLPRRPANARHSGEAQIGRRSSGPVQAVVRNSYGYFDELVCVCVRTKAQGRDLMLTTQRDRCDYIPGWTYLSTCKTLSSQIVCIIMGWLCPRGRPDRTLPPGRFRAAASSVVISSPRSQTH